MTIPIFLLFILLFDIFKLNNDDHNPNIIVALVILDVLVIFVPSVVITTIWLILQVYIFLSLKYQQLQDLVNKRVQN